MYYRTLNFLFLQFIKSDIDWEKKPKFFPLSHPVSTWSTALKKVYKQSFYIVFMSK